MWVYIVSHPHVGGFTYLWCALCYFIYLYTYIYIHYTCMCVWVYILYNICIYINMWVYVLMMLSIYIYMSSLRLNFCCHIIYSDLGCSCDQFRYCEHVTMITSHWIHRKFLIKMFLFIKSANLYFDMAGWVFTLLKIFFHILNVNKQKKIHYMFYCLSIVLL